MPPIRAQQRDQFGQLGTHERLAAGDAELANPKCRNNFHDCRDLCKRHQAIGLHEAGNFGHAVLAADVAAVRYANAQ